MNRARFLNNHQLTKVKQEIEFYLNWMKQLARGEALERGEWLELESEMKWDEMEEEKMERRLLSFGGAEIRNREEKWS